VAVPDFPHALSHAINRLWDETSKNPGSCGS